MLNLQWASATDTGRLRPANEDSLLCTPVVFAVADGMGGHAAGELASRLAIEALTPLGAATSLSVDDLAGAISEANHTILAAGRERADQSGLGTTVTGIGVVNLSGIEHWAVFNVGDSRVYRYTGGVLSQLTVDHSAVQELVAAGLLRPEEVDQHPQRHVVTRYLGSRPAPRPDIDVYEPVPGERFVICSDGLTNELADTDLARLLGEELPTQQLADELVRQANQAGGHDNITVVVLDLLPAPAEQAAR